MIMMINWKFSLFAQDNEGKNKFLDRSMMLGRIVRRCKMEVKNFKQFEIFKDDSEYVVRGYVQPNGHIDWVKEY